MNKIILILLLIPFMGYSQEQQKSGKEVDSSTPKDSYISLSVGGSFGSIRDFATSPLTYNGVGSYISLSRHRTSAKREVETGINHSFGAFLSIYNEHPTLSSVNRFSFYHSQLFSLGKLNNSRWNYKLGAEINVLGDVRINQSLRNNGFGMEYIPTVFASFKVTRDLSRLAVIHKKFLIFKYQKKPINRNLAFRFDAGVLNSSLRNGFAYADQSSLLNNSKIFGDYQFNYLSGLRFKTAVDYTVYRHNKNAIQLSYLWGALKTANTFDVFELSHHTLKISLLFNTNKSS